MNVLSVVLIILTQKQRNVKVFVKLEHFKINLLTIVHYAQQNLVSNVVNVIQKHV